ncbi:MAG: hypothetical protein ACI9QV_000719, partial [Methylophagaceae bacterium]
MSEINNMNVNRIKQTLITMLLASLFTGCSSITSLDEIVTD